MMRVADSAVCAPMSAVSGSASHNTTAQPQKIILRGNNMSEQGSTQPSTGGSARRIRRRLVRPFFDQAPVALYRTTQDGRFLQANPALAALLGYATVDELLAVPVASLYVDPAQRAAQMCRVEQAHAAVVDEICLRRKDGAAIWVRDTFSPVYDETGRLQFFEGSLEDVTQRHTAIAALQQSQQRLELALASADLGMYDWNLNTGELIITERYATMLGYTPAEMNLSFEGWQRLVHPDDLQSVLAALEQRLQGRPVVAMNEYRMRARSGEWRWIQDRAGIVERTPDGKPLRMVGFHLDITERRRAEERSARLNRSLRVVMQCSEAIVRARDEVSLLDQVCGILADVGGYRLAWVGRAEQDAYKSIRPVAQRGDACGYLTEIALTWGDDPSGTGPIETAIRTAAPILSRDIAADQRFLWRQAALAHGLRSALALPLLVRGRAVAALGIYAATPDAFDAEELHFLETLAQDVSLGITTLRTSAERDELLEALFVSERRLREMLESVQLVVVALNREGEVTFCNEYLARVLELRRAEVIGSNWFVNFIPADQQTQVRESFGQMLGEASVAAHFESDLLTGQGERRTISWSFTTTRDMNARVIGVTGIGEDITDRLRMTAARDELLTQVVAAHERLQSLSRQLVRVQEDERRNLARELHDEIGQSLTALKIMLDVSLKTPATANANLRQAQMLLNELIGKVRDLSLDLRPGMLDDLGLLPALLWLLDRYTQQTNVQVSFHHAQLDDRRFAPEIETAAYRIVQEALTNVARHSQSDRAFVEVRVTDNTLYVEVRDEGCGFDAAAALSAGYAAGLSGLRERVALLSGRLNIESAPGQGTRVSVNLPLH